MRLVLDMNLSPTWAPLLAERGHDVVHWAEVGDPRASDATVMAWARADARAVMTHDLDFTAILAATGARGPSVVQVRTQDVSPQGTLAPTLIAALARHEPTLLKGAILVVDAARARVRVLPLWPVEPG